MEGKSPVNEVVVGLLSFLIVWILDTVNMVLFFQLELKIAVHILLTKKKICEVSNLWCFFKESYFILMFFQEEFASLLSHFPVI